MALKPIPPRPNIEGDDARYEADMKHFRENPAHWNPPAGLRDQASQTIFDDVNKMNADQEETVRKQYDAEIAALDGEKAEQESQSTEETPKRGPGRPRQFTRKD